MLSFVSCIYMVSVKSNRTVTETVTKTAKKCLYGCFENFIYEYCIYIISPFPNFSILPSQIHDLFMIKIDSHTYKRILLSPFIAVPVYVCLGMTTGNWIAYQRSHLWRRQILPLSEIMNCLLLYM